MSIGSLFIHITFQLKHNYKVLQINSLSSTYHHNAFVVKVHKNRDSSSTDNLN